MSIRELNRSDYNELAKFLSIFATPNLPVKTYQKKFKIWWDINTHCDKSDLLGWVIVDENEEPGNQIKGFMGNIPRKYKIGGKIIKTANATSWFVNPKYRKQAIFLMYAYLKQKTDLLVNSTSGAMSEPIFKQVGFTDFAITHKSFLSISNKKFLQHFLEKKLSSNYSIKIISLLLFPIFLFYNFFSNFFSESLELKDCDQIAFKNNEIEFLDISWLKSEGFNIKLHEITKHGTPVDYIVSQYVKNPVNELNYIQILYSNLYNLRYLNSIKSELIRAHQNESDFIMISNCKNVGWIFTGFIDISRFIHTTCFAMGDKINLLSNKHCSSIFGEKGFMIWN